MNTYIIEGGIGKQVAFTAIIDALVKKEKKLMLDKELCLDFLVNK
jgi:hypothetical protein